ncbi:MAG TPA: hypothetical protein VLE74_02765 [Candidatus Saccharimonadales bacterium]|nr:hypothetical protein [Candidatus Saccharimonadales bacterium]
MVDAHELERRPDPTEEEMPRFLQATEGVVDYMHQVGRATGELSRAAQNFDFITSRSLGHQSELVAARWLRDVIITTIVPAEITEIYQGLYGSSLDEILGPVEVTTGIEANG